MLVSLTDLLCRWLPTVIGAASGALVITAALAFDSYMVMRHGMDKTAGQTRSCLNGSDSPTGTASDVKGGAHLGCYFCGDVVPPGDSRYV